MHICGTSTLCGIISMACLNFGLGICYKPQHMYIAGIINGPQEPYLTGLNHYMRPLVEDMAICWDPGVYFSQTALFPNDHLTCSTIAATVCDLPAAQKAA